MPRMIFNPRIQDNIAVPDDMPDDEVQAIFMEADAEQRSAQGYPPVANLAQFLGGMYGQQQQFQPQTTLPNISGKDTYGMSPEQTANLIGTFQQDAQSKVDQQFKMRAENERRMEAEKDRSQQLKLEAARMKNDAMDRKLREQQHKDSLDMDEKRLVQDESQSVRAFNQNATDSQRQYDLDVQQGRVSAANQAAGNSLQAQQLQAQIDRDNTALMEGRIDRGLLGLQNMRKAKQEKTDAENLNIYRMGTIGVNQDKADNNYELGLMRVAVQEGRMSVEEFNAISRRMGVAVSDKRADIYGTSVDNQGRRIDSQNTTDQQNTDIRGRQVDGTLAQGDRRLDQGDRKLGQADRGLDIREKDTDSQITARSGKTANDAERIRATERVGILRAAGVSAAVYNKMSPQEKAAIDRKGKVLVRVNKIVDDAVLNPAWNNPVSNQYTQAIKSGLSHKQAYSKVHSDTLKMVQQQEGFADAMAEEAAPGGGTDSGAGIFTDKNGNKTTIKFGTVRDGWTAKDKGDGTVVWSKE